MKTQDLEKLPRNELLKRLTRLNTSLEFMIQEVNQHELIGAPEGAYPRGYLAALRYVKERLEATY